jgi:hypothetical protein
MMIQFSTIQYNRHKITIMNVMWFRGTGNLQGILGKTDEMNEHLRFTVNSMLFWLSMDQDIRYNSLMIQYINL